MNSLQQPSSNRAQNNWRRSTGALPQSAPHYAANNGFANIQQQMAQMQQQQLLAKQQEIYNLQQAQMELQLQQLRIQNLEMQGRILAASGAQQSEAMTATVDQQRATQRRSALFNGLNLPLDRYPASVPSSASAYQDSFTVEDQQQSPENARLGALQNLQRAQQNRVVSQGQEINVAKRPNRLSFVGGEGLAEHALARKRSGAFSPQSQPEVVTPPAQVMTHHRKTSSQSSSSSQFFNDQRKQMSPPSGPTLVLSQPGEQYPSPSRSPKARRLTVSTNRQMPNSQENSDASSPHSSDTDSINSESASFESNTTVASDVSFKGLSLPSLGKRAVSDSTITQKNSVPILNPSASAFTPGSAASSPRADQLTFRNKRDSSSSLGYQYPSVLDRPTGFRHVTAPSVLMQGAVAIRQPKGPAREDEMATMNFNARLRKQALMSLKRNRNSFVPAA